MRSRSIELLAPVGSYESLEAAIAGGADAVYFGVEQLNMRARSSNNFTVDDLRAIVSKCHEEGVKAYLTINTILYDHDIRLMYAVVDAAADAVIDGVIAMDPAVMMYARDKGVSVNVSTQANITNLETIRFYAQFADVMVLSRELTLQQVAKICQDVTKHEIKGPSGELVKIETFVHGALCMAVSGKCYLSLHTMNSSANRGACKQNCRRTYTVKDDEGNELEIDNEYIMSPKDMNTIEFLDKILDAGVSILKIEGRSKGPDYVQAVTSCYREAIDIWSQGENPTAMQRSNWSDRLTKVYNRGFWGGYYLGKKMGEWTDTDGSKATQIKQYLGRTTNYFSKIGVGEFVIEKDNLKKGDRVMITGPSLGMFESEVLELRSDDGQPIEEASKGMVFSMPIDTKLRKSDKLFKVVDRS